MALQFHSIYQTVGDGTNTTFTVPFPFLEKSHIHAFINSVQVYAYFSYGQSSQITIEPAPQDGDELLIRRITPIDNPLVEFKNRSTLTEKQLNRATQQILYAQQELKDGILSGIYGLNADGLDGLDGTPQSIVDDITKRVTETALYQELQDRTTDIESNINSILAHTLDIDGLNEKTLGLSEDSESLAESAIEGYLRENDNLETVRLTEHEVGNNKARIELEEVTRATEDSALAGRIDTISATADDNSAAIQTEQLARADEDEALATQIETVAAASANIFRSATAPDPSTVTLNVDDLWFDTSDENHPYQWNGTSWVDAQDGGINVNAAAIQTEQTARANADSALASDITTVQTQAEGNTSSIETQATSIDGLQAQYTVKIDINGRVVGFGLASDGTGDVTNGSDFIINADNFSVLDPDTGELSIGWDAASSAFVVNGDLISNGTIKALKLDVPQLSNITTNLGVITAGTFKTSDSSTGYRVEMSDSGSYPLWYGTGAKTAANARFYMDANGGAMYRGGLDIRSASGGARLEIRDNVIKVYDSNEAVRVVIGDLTA